MVVFWRPSRRAAAENPRSSTTITNAAIASSIGAGWLVIGGRMARRPSGYFCLAASSRAAFSISAATALGCET